MLASYANVGQALPARAATSPTITTQATAFAYLGGTISDTATLSGGNLPTGLITFSIFGPDDINCTGAPVAGSTSVNGNGSYTPGPFTPVLPGTYRWVASYSGDANNNSATTACNDAGESSVVAKATPTIATQATVSANTGTTISDIATLLGGNAPTGTITFAVFGPNDTTCTASPLGISSSAVNGNGSYSSGPFNPVVAGTYRWVASYGGDANNNSAATACNDVGETTSVSKADPTITTQATASAFTGGTISDTATLSGGNGPTGTITFTLFGPDDTACAGPPFGASEPVNGNGSYTSDTFTPLLPGAYRFVASYGGDANNNSATTACNDAGETSTVTKTSPTITTQATASANPGDALSDTATLTGGNVPTGSITFAIFGPNDATCTGLPVTGSSTINGNGSYTSGTFSPPLPGTYRFVVSYSGDANNNSATTACNDAGETSIVTGASPTITTQATASVNPGGTMSDTASLSGGNGPTGSITFTVFGPNDATCTGTPGFNSTTPVSGNGSYGSASFTAVLPGTYRWVASYSGDVNNNPATTACNDAGETSTVSKPSPTITCPAPLGAEATLVGGAQVVPGVASATGDGVTITGPASGFYPLGITTVTYTATDSSGSTISCTTSITVVDTTRPSITCPAPITAEATGNASAFVNPGSATATDIAGSVTIAGPAAGSYPLGTTTVTYTATDQSGNTSSCTSTITVVDTTPPSISCPAPITVEATGNGSAFVNPGSASAIDSGGPVTVTNPAAGSYPLGTTTLTYTATDQSGNTSSCTSTITVVDTTAPSITCPANIVVAVGANGTATVTFIATASDVAGPVQLTYSQAPGTRFPLGVTTVIATATDASGNKSTCSFTVTVGANAVGISDIVSQLLAAGCINNSGIANALTAKLVAAQIAIAAGNLKTAINILTAFIDQVEAQNGKHILASCTLNGVTFSPAAVLIADARNLIASLAVAATPNPITGSVVTATGLGVSGATLSLVDLSSGKTLATATTDVTGFYFFPTTGLLTSGGTYSVSVTGVPTGLTSSSAARTFTWAGLPISLNNFTLT